MLQSNVVNNSQVQKWVTGGSEAVFSFSR